MPRTRKGTPPQLGLFEAPAPAPSRVVAMEKHNELAATLPPTLHLGTSSWTFPGWAGLVYGGKPSQAWLTREGLAAYAGHPLFRTVGVDRTYYATVSADVLAGYAAQVPDDFRFLVKAAEACVVARFPGHPRYGALRGERNERFLDAAWATDHVVAPFVEGLGEKGGVLLFQLPPQSMAELGGAEGFAEKLHGFLRCLPKGPLYAVELRNGPLLNGRYVEALADVGAVHCYNVHGGMIPFEEQLRRVDPARWPVLVTRWMLHAGQRYEEAVERYSPFSALVDEDPTTRELLARVIADAAARAQRTWVVVNNKAEGCSPLSIAALAQRVAALQSGGQR